MHIKGVQETYIIRVLAGIKLYKLKNDDMSSFFSFIHKLILVFFEFLLRFQPAEGDEGDGVVLTAAGCRNGSVASSS